ncbi:MAG TPA: hypothetical protein VET48_04385 [Steroidobacteraceae bacterium]|nr:hypothetical protein [Steroidobacteraceae bacterium]
MNAVVANLNSQIGSWSAKNFFWLIKRELWEHRGRFLITPLVIAAIFIFLTIYALVFKLHAVNIGAINLNGTGGDVVIHSPARFLAYGSFAIAFFAVMVFVSAYYALDTLYADRRDRSILFWKSLPVSDFETVLSKLVVLTFVSPLIVIAISIATQWIVFAAISIKLAANGQSFGLLWTELPVVENVTLILYAFVVVGLWLLPIHAWCLLASAWAQRAVFLWATVPVGVLWFLEYQIFGTNYIGHLLRDRTIGVLPVAFSIPHGAMEGRKLDLSGMQLSDLLTPGVFFSSVQLWGGLLVAAALIAATVWVRRYRETA